MNELRKSSVKNKVEAILFSTGHRIGLDEISRLSRSKKEDVVVALQELKKEYEEKQSSLMLVEEGDYWKFTVRDHFIPIVRKIVTETELTKTVLETLAVVAFKYPILQSDLIKIRTNKAYDHLVELEKSGYISRQKHGRTNLIKLTDKFFKYFDLTEEKLKDQFNDFESIAKAIGEKEEEVEKIKEDQRKKAEDLKKEDEKIRKEIEALDESEEEFEVPLETYETKAKDIISQELVQEGNLIVEKEKIGDLEIIEQQKNIEPKKEKFQSEVKSEETKPHIEAPLKEETEVRNGYAHEAKKQEREDLKPVIQQQHAEQRRESLKTASKTREQKKVRRGIKLTPEMEANVDKKVNEMLGIKIEGKEEKKEQQ